MTETVILNYLISFLCVILKSHLGMMNSEYLYCAKDPEGKIVNVDYDMFSCTWCGLLTMYWCLYLRVEGILFLFVHILYKLIGHKTGWPQKSIATIFRYLVTSGNLRNWGDDFRILWHCPLPKSYHVLIFN